jgi:hypothetical protein
MAEIAANVVLRLVQEGVEREFLQTLRGGTQCFIIDQLLKLAGLWLAVNARDTSKPPEDMRSGMRHVHYLECQSGIPISLLRLIKPAGVALRVP